jgi:uncharacterized protein YecE (DUF72 family)
MPPAKMLAYYSERLTTVEINNTFYRMPTSKVVSGWAAEAPATFTFAVKAPQRITHIAKLQNAAELTETFVTIVSALGPRLGPLLFQLPPFLRKDVPRLVDFLALLPRETRAAFEFRHTSWFDDAVYEVLRTHGAALCVADAEDLATPLVSTTSWSYLRLRRTDYDEAALGAWAKKLTGMDTAWADAFVYFKHEDAGLGPKLAAQFVEKLAQC